VLADHDFFLEVRRGNVPGYSILEGLGERDSIGTTAAGEDITRINELSSTPAAPGSHLFIPRPADAGEQMTIISENDADNGGTATGALTVCIKYLDATGNPQTEIVTMNGTTAVNTTATDIRFVQELQVLTVGSNTTAEGHIRIYRFGTNTRVYNMIAAGGNQSLVPHRMVPFGKTFYGHSWTCSEMSNSKRSRVRLRADCSNAVVPVRQADVFLFKSVMALDGSVGTAPLAFAAPALSVIKASAWAVVSGAEIGVHWWGVLVGPGGRSIDLATVAG